MFSQSYWRNVAAKWCLSVAILGLTFPTLVKAADDKPKEESRVTESGNVMKELTNADNGIPIGLLNKSECVIVLPSVKKAGFIVGASYGRGVMRPAAAALTSMAPGALPS